MLTAGQRREKGRLALHRELKDENENSHPPNTTPKPFSITT